MGRLTPEATVLYGLVPRKRGTFKSMKTGYIFFCTPGDVSMRSSPGKQSITPVGAIDIRKSRTGPITRADQRLERETFPSLYCMGRLPMNIGKQMC